MPFQEFYIDFYRDVVGPEPWNFLFGLILIFAFSPEQFSKPSIELSGLPIRFVGSLSSLTSPQRYFGAMAFYVSGLVFLYVMLCKMGPEGLADLRAGGDDSALSAIGIDENSIRLLVALVIVGIVPYFPLINQLEIKFRRSCHRLANLPDFASDYASRITDLPFNRAKIGITENAFEREIKIAIRLRDDQTKEQQRTLLDAWLAIAWRVGFLVLAVQREGGGLFDRKLIRLLKPEIAGVEERAKLIFLSLRQQYAEEPEEGATSIELGDLSERLHRLRRRVSFTTALLVLRGRSRQVSLLEAKQFFGIDDIDTDPGRPRIETAVSIASIIFLVGVLVLLISDWAVPIVLPIIGIDHDTFYGREQIPSVVSALLSAFLVVGGVVWAAVAFRNDKILRNTWFRWSEGKPIERRIENYAVAAGICVISSLILNYLYRGALESAWTDVAGTVSESAPFALVHVFVGVILLWNLDYMRLTEPLAPVRGRVAYAFAQASVVGAIGAAMGYLYHLRVASAEVYVLYSALASFAACLVVSIVTLLLAEPRVRFTLEAVGDAERIST